MYPKVISIFIFNLLSYLKKVVIGNFRFYLKLDQLYRYYLDKKMFVIQMIIVDLVRNN